MTTRALMVPFALAQLSTENPVKPRAMLSGIGRINSLKVVALQQDAAIEFSRDAWMSRDRGDNNKETRHD